MKKSQKIVAGMTLAVSLLAGSFGTSAIAEAQTPQLQEKPLLVERHIKHTPSFYEQADGTLLGTSVLRVHVFVDPTIQKTDVVRNNCTPARLLYLGC